MPYSIRETRVVLGQKRNVRSRRARCKTQADVERSMERNVRRTSGDGNGGSCLDESSVNTKGRCVHFHKTVSIGPARRHAVFHRRFSFIFGFVSPTYTILEETRSVHPISRRVNTLADGKPSSGYIHVLRPRAVLAPVLRRSNASPDGTARFLRLTIERRNV